jgi:hypothetical protein
MPDAPQRDGKIYRPANPGEGFRWDTADGAQRRAQIERHRGRAAQGDPKKNGIESKSKSRLSSDAFGKRFDTSSSLQGVVPDELGLTAHSDSLSGRRLLKGVTKPPPDWGTLEGSILCHLQCYKIALHPKKGQP